MGQSSIYCKNCGCSDTSKLEFVQGGKAIFCKVCRNTSLLSDNNISILGSIQVDGIISLEKKVDNAKNLIKLEEYDKAIKELNDLSGNYSDNPEVWYYLALAESRNLTLLGTDAPNEEVFLKHFDYAGRYAKEGSEIAKKIGKVRKILENNNNFKLETGNLQKMDSDFEALQYQVKAQQEKVDQQTASVQRIKEQVLASQQNCKKMKQKRRINNFGRLLRFLLALVTAAVCLFLYSIVHPGNYPFINSLQKFIGAENWDKWRKALEELVHNDKQSLGIAMYVFGALAFILLISALKKSQKRKALDKQHRIESSEIKHVKDQLKSSEKALTNTAKELDELKKQMEAKKNERQGQQDKLNALRKHDID